VNKKFDKKCKYASG